MLSSEAEGGTKRLIQPTQAQEAGGWTMGSTVALDSYGAVSIACSDTKQA